MPPFDTDPTPVVDPTSSIADLAAERTVLASVLGLPTALEEIHGLVAAEDFHKPGHREVFRIAVDLRNRGEAVDETTVASQLARRKMLDRLGGIDWLRSLRDAIVSTDVLRTHAKHIADLASQRRLVETARLIVADGLVATDDPRAFVERSAKRFSDAAETRGDSRVELIYDVVARRFAEWELMREGHHFSSLPSGFPSIDAVTDGMRIGSVSFVGALTGGGKSLFAWQVANHVAGLELHGEKLGVCYVSGEMDGGELTDRGVCARAGVTYRSFRRVMCGARDRENEYPLHPNETEQVRSMILHAANEMAATPMTIFARIGGINDIRAAVRASNRQFAAHTETGKKSPKTRLLVVDYVQLMRLEKAERSDLALGKFAMELKDLAETNKLHVLCLSQVLKSSKSNALGRPSNEDLKNATALSDAAHTVMFIHRPWRYMEGRPDRDQWKNYIEFLLTKGRSHEGGAIAMRFEGDRCRFAEPKPGEFAHLKQKMDEAESPKAYAPGSTMRRVK